MEGDAMQLCLLSEIGGATGGKPFLSGAVSATTQLLIVQNREASPGDPGWIAYLVERATPTPRAPRGKPRPKTHKQ